MQKSYVLLVWTRVRIPPTPLLSLKRIRFSEFSFFIYNYHNLYYHYKKGTVYANTKNITPKKFYYEKFTMVSRSYLHYCLAIRNVERCSRNRYKFFSTCIIGNCCYCCFIQYYQRKKTFRLKTKLLEEKKSISQIVIMDFSI